MPPKAYVIAQIAQIDDQENYACYRDLVGPTVASHNGRFLVRGGPAQRIEGDEPCGRMVIIEFPSVAQATAWYNSAEYQTALALRLASSTGTVMIVEGT